MYVDTHVHLQAADFEKDLDAVIERARGAGVNTLVTVGIDLASSEKALAIAERDRRIYAAVGVHPNELDNVPPDWPEKLRALARRPGVKAVGESGLDFYRRRTAPEKQIEGLKRHLEIARETALPVILHSRASGKAVLDVVEEFISESGPVRGIMHCFTEHMDVMQRAVRLGLYVSFAGPSTYPISRRNREVMKAVPDTRILIETDAPYLGAQPVKHRRNEPAYLRYVATKAAEVRRVSPRDMSRITKMNSDDLFGLGIADRSPRIVYGIRSVLYLNITNRCTNTCRFCPRVWGVEKGPDAEGAFIVKGHNLRLEREPAAEELIAAMGDISPYKEVVFCGFGEPTVRLDALIQVAKWIRVRGQRVRLDTNGQGSLHHGRSIVPDLTEALDAVWVSLNTADPDQYVELCRPERGREAYDAVVQFIREAREYIPEVVATAVEVPGVDMKAVKRLCRELKVRFHARKYNRVG